MHALCPITGLKILCRGLFVAGVVVQATALVRGEDSGVGRRGPLTIEPAAGPQAVADDERAEDARAGRIPPVPDGTPQELMRYIEQISDPAAIPRSRGRGRYYLKKAAGAFGQVADRILAQVEASDPLYREAVQLKLDGFAMLDSLGEPTAAERIAFARGLVDSADRRVARQARRTVLAADVDALYAARTADGAEPLIAAAVRLLEDDPEDAVTAKIAAQLGLDLAALPGAEPVARQALETFVRLMAASRDDRVREGATRLAASLRRVSLVGAPLVVAGRLVDGTEFDPRPLAGKVVLVSFWSTTHPASVAEMAVIRAAYDKYRAAGLEVVAVSLDREQDAVAALVTEQRIPWPVLVDGVAPADSLAERCGVTTLPATFVLGRDGTVLSVRAQGETLAAQLAEQFPGRP